MSKTKKVIKVAALVSLTIVGIAVLYHVRNSGVTSEYIELPSQATHFNGQTYVGSAACMACHSEIYHTHVQTPHYRTSMPAEFQNIQGSFENDSNVLKTKDATFTMVSDNGSLFQVARQIGNGDTLSVREMDIVLGSGVKGQAFLTWEEDRLYQLQVSYYVPSGSWVNSPNYPPYYLEKLRPISDFCLKCHTTFAQNLDSRGLGNRYKERSVLMGVDCERCHNPAARHVGFHRKNPEESEARFIVRFDSLSRKRRMDVCASCHAGLRNNKIQGNPYAFVTGEDLEDYSQNYQSLRSGTALDVHGNQYGLLVSSKCFQQSGAMECVSCHDPHKKQRGQRGFFNQKCIGCHGDNNKVHCSLDRKAMVVEGKDCIACHMPAVKSATMMVQSSIDSIAKSVDIRTHLIGIYPKEFWEDRLLK